jgi:hypothetical protein
MLEFLCAVAEAPVVLDEHKTTDESDCWQFSWDEAIATDGHDLRVVAEVSRSGETRFTVTIHRDFFERVASTATVNPYELAWRASVTYARTLVEIAKIRALAKLPSRPARTPGTA